MKIDIATIIEDVKANTNLIDIEKYDFVSLLTRLYPNIPEQLMSEIKSLLNNWN